MPSSETHSSQSSFKIISCQFLSCHFLNFFSFDNMIPKVQSSLAAGMDVVVICSWMYAPVCVSLHLCYHATVHAIHSVCGTACLCVCVRMCVYACCECVSICWYGGVCQNNTCRLHRRFLRAPACHSETHTHTKCVSFQPSENFCMKYPRVARKWKTVVFFPLC